MKQKPIVLFVGIYSSTYHSGAMVRALGELGYDVRVIDWQRYRFQSGTESLNNYVLAEAKGVRSEFIFMQIQNNEAFSRGTWSKLNDIAPVINYTFDVRDNISWYKEVAPDIALTVFACDRDVKDCWDVGIKNVMHSHSSCDMELYKPVPGRIECPEIVFIGNDLTKSNMNFPQAQQRKDMVAFMQKEFGSRFGVYGNGWEGSRTVYPTEEVLIYNNCKIAITQNHFDLPGYSSDRQWRAISCGALTICQYYGGFMTDLMNDLPKSPSWINFEELATGCKYFLNNFEQRQQFSLMNMVWVRTHHSWGNRFKHMLNNLNVNKNIKEPY